MRRLAACFAVLLCVLAAPHRARAEAAVPAQLEPWRGWVLQGQEFRACPLVSGRAGTAAADFLCAWPAPLVLAADADGATFSQRWRSEVDTWIALPGDADHWPQQVTLDGQPAAVVDRGGPALRIAAGSHEVRARIPWRERPQTLRVPQALGLVNLTVDGKPIAPVQRDGDELSLGRAAAAAPEADSLDLRVYRRLADGVPARLTTVIEIRASGQAREEIIGPALPRGFAALALESGWPARLDNDGRLRVRVQPGADTLTLEARATDALTQIVAHLPAPPWPRQEIWSYEADPRLRVTSATSAVQVDPQQNAVPDDWRALPAFALADGAQIAIEERSRGLAGDDRNRLSLAREMWLDFDGGAWFARDRVQGEMLQGWRLDAAKPFAVERAQAVGAGRGEGGNEALLVTQGATPELTGVEWRTPSVDLAAGLRVARTGASVPVAGWQDSFDRVITTLHLPNGYRLLGAPGADRAGGSWMSSWTLLDVFVAAVLALLAGRLFGAPGGLVTVAYLVLGYQESGSPRWIVLTAIALGLVVRALPGGRLGDVARWSQRVVLVLFALVALPFVADQLRYALHPQLENDGGLAFARYDEGGMAMNAQKAAPAPEPSPPPPPPAMSAPADVPVEADAVDGAVRPQQEFAKQRDARTRGGLASKTITVTASTIRKLDIIDHYSQSTVVQTGAGEPGWQLGHRYELSWSGPVLPTQEVSLLIAPPWVVRPLRVVLVALLAWLFVRLARPSLRVAWPRAAASVLAGGIALAALQPAPAHAQAFPPDTLLNDLRARLIQPPKCAPACATIAKVEVAARGDEIRVALEAHAVEHVAVPLPFDEKALTLRSVGVDGTAQADGIARYDASLWIALPRGVHRIELVFAAAADRVALAFPLRPMRAQFSGEGWEASGIMEDRLLTETVTLARARAAGDRTAPIGAQQFDPFVRVERTLNLGLDWSIATRALRLAPKEGGFTVAVPLLAGEHVTTAGVRVENGRAIAAIANDAMQTDWSATLDKSASLSLTAPALGERAEVWRVLVSPTWHAEFSGVPGVAMADGEDAHDLRVFEFHPLPGETLEIKVTHPAAVAGATRAIDSVQLAHEVGQRAATSVLALSLRASQGGDQVVTLPAGAEVIGVTRDGAPLNLRPQNGRLSLPVIPGAHRFEIRWRENAAVGFVTRTPAIALGLPAANIETTIDVPADRWLLATGGPASGPAVLYWSELAVMLLIAFALSRTRRTPLPLWQWILLGLGFSTFSWIALLLVIAWLFALDWRARSAPLAAQHAFNLAQIGLAALTVVALVCVLASIQQGLLGNPDMHVTGNGSGAYTLRWFADRSADALPGAYAVSVPLWVYKIAMLAWALWLANALVGWLRSGFAAWSSGGYWRSTPRPIVEVPDTVAPPPP